jgi:hypothetical protein
MRIFEISKMVDGEWVHVEYMKARQFPHVEKYLDRIKIDHLDATAWRIAAYKRVEDGVRTYPQRIL